MEVSGRHVNVAVLGCATNHEQQIDGGNSHVCEGEQRMSGRNEDAPDQLQARDEDRQQLYGRGGGWSQVRQHDSYIGAGNYEL